MKKCILWKGAKNSLGYGYKTIKNKQYLVHRLVLAKKLGRPIKKGHCVCHICDNPSCINPAHLLETTQAENLKDMFRKNRQWLPIRAKLTLKQVRKIRSLKGTNTLILANRFKVHRRTIQRILSGHSWQHIKADHLVPFHNLV